MVARGRGRNGVTGNGDRVSLWSDDHVLEFYSGDICTTV